MSLQISFLKALIYAYIYALATSASKAFYYPSLYHGRISTHHPKVCKLSERSDHNIHERRNMTKQCRLKKHDTMIAMGNRRRKILRQSASLINSSILITAFPLVGSGETPNDKYQATGAYVSAPNQNFRYTLIPPPSFITSNKPLRTHLDEIIFSSTKESGYSIGVTVDPVRINSIREFGTPEEVAARVVTAEVNRDGIFKVTLAKDPIENDSYDIEYISEGKRGIKRFLTRIYVRNGFLYVMTVQIKESDFDEIREKEIKECVESFKPL